MRSFTVTLLFWLAATASSFGDDENWIRGKVVDEVGKPVEGAVVGTYWSCNGTQKAPDGRELDVKKPDELALIWGNLGRMEPSSPRGLQTSADGTFELKASWRTHFVMAMDRERRRGGIFVIRKGHEGEPLEVRLSPLIHVQGRLEGPTPGTKPEWTNVYTILPDDPERPADYFRLAHCGSFEARFEMRLPPGTYRLNAYSYEGKSKSEVVDWPSITLTADKPEVDLGTFTLQKSVSFGEQIDKLKAGGKWGDLTQHYGKRPPRIFAQDSRGVPRDFQLWDKPGKWVLVEFWGLDCAPCLGKSLPRLMKFQEAHAADRDKFEIITVFIDVEEKIRTMGQLDEKLKPVVEHLWDGKALPFPILLDSGFQTWESYGLPGLGTILLIDLEGNLVKGEIEKLEEILKKH